MGYRSEVRIVTTKEGFQSLKNHVEDYIKSKKGDTDYNLMKSLDINYESKDGKIRYFGWSWVKWYDGDYVEVDAVVSGLDKLEEEDISYRFSRQGEDLSDIDKQSYDSEKNNIDLPYPSMLSGFDDEYGLSEIDGVDLNKTSQKENQTEIDKEMEDNGV